MFHNYVYQILFEASPILFQLNYTVILFLGSNFRDQALLAHASQVAPGDLFFAVSPEQQRDIWPWEDYVLIDSRVKTELPEFDFADGIDFSN